MTETDRTRIFERFGRGTSARRTDADGAGLGLSISAAIAAAHGGGLGLTDTPGGGATFTIRIPLDRTSQTSAEPPEDRSWPAS